MSSKLAYFPVPTKRREVKVWPPRRSGGSWSSFAVGGCTGEGFWSARAGSTSPRASAPAHQRHDLEPVSLGEQGPLVLGTRHEPAVALDRHAPRAEAEGLDQAGDARLGRELALGAVDD